MKENRLTNHLLLALILLSGIVLRFWDYFNLPFTFDEMSAMSRTVYDNFSDLIKYGVVERDTHPAGVQVFMYFWVIWFGEAEWIVKLPFVLAGVASIWLSYKIAKLWFGQTAAYLTAAFVSSLQLFVMYSQMARPYASGLFLTLMMVFFWSRYFMGKGGLINLVLFVLFASLSSYNHYFSLLFAAIVGFSGFFFLKKKQTVPYILAGMAIFLLYIPHLSIFFAQLDKGGIGGWLGTPGYDFPLKFFSWLFHYSLWVIGVLALVFLFGLISGTRKTSVDHLYKKRFVLAIWFLVPLIIGFVYSIIREPILQYSLLLFSTPYFFMLVFSFMKEMEMKKLVMAVSLILLVNILTLVIKREHYKIFYHQGFEEVVKQGLELENRYPSQVFIINNYIPYYMEYYFRKYDDSIPYFTVRNKDLSIPQFKKVLASIKEDVAVTSAIKDDYFQLVNEEFPYVIETNRGFTFEHYAFSKKESDAANAILPDTLAFLDFDRTDNNWSVNKDLILQDSLSGKKRFEMTPSTKYGPSIEIPLNDFTEHGYTFLDISATITALDNIHNAVLVVEVKRGNEAVNWLGKNLYEFELKNGESEKVNYTIYLHDALKTSTDIEGCTIKFYVFNPNQNHFLIENILITTRPGNPYRYALFYDFIPFD